MAIPQHASASRGEFPPGLLHGSSLHQNGYIHPSLEEAERKGGEPAVLRQIEQRMVSEFITQCDREGIKVENLGTHALRERLHGTLSGMVNANRTQMTGLAYDSFRDFYHHSRKQIQANGGMIAEKNLAEVVDIIRLSQSAKLTPAEKSLVESAVLRQAEVAGSAYRVAGISPKRAIEHVRLNTDVGTSWLADRIEEAIEGDIRRRPAEAREQRAASARMAIPSTGSGPRMGPR